MAIDQNHTSKYRHIPTAQLRIDVMFYNVDFLYTWSKSVNIGQDEWMKLIYLLNCYYGQIWCLFPRELKKCLFSVKGWHHSAINASSRQRTCWRCHDEETISTRLLMGLTRTNLETNLATFADDGQNVTVYTLRKIGTKLSLWWYPFKRH